MIARTVLFIALCFVLELTSAATQNTSVLSKKMSGNVAVLLGETHDDSFHHEFRYQALKKALENGWRPSLAMEQFDIEYQSEIDQARRERPYDVDYLIRNSTPKSDGWDWKYYSPFIELALKYNLPIIAVNLSRNETRKIMEDKQYKSDFEIPLNNPDFILPGEINNELTKLIGDGHCGKVSIQEIQKMVRVQAVKDMVMAAIIRKTLPRPIVLLAGSVHVRKDVGIPQWLRNIPQESLVAVGFVDEANKTTQDIFFDLQIITRKVHKESESPQVCP